MGYLHSSCLLMSTVVLERRMHCTVYLSIQLSSHKIWACPNNTAALLIQLNFFDPFMTVLTGFHCFVKVTPTWLLWKVQKFYLPTVSKYTTCFIYSDVYTIVVNCWMVNAKTMQRGSENFSLYWWLLHSIFKLHTWYCFLQWFFLQ